MCENVIKQFFHKLNSVFISRNSCNAFYVAIDSSDKRLILNFDH